MKLLKHLQPNRLHDYGVPKTWPPAHSLNRITELKMRLLPGTSEDLLFTLIFSKCRTFISTLQSEKIGWQAFLILLPSLKRRTKNIVSFMEVLQFAEGCCTDLLHNYQMLMKNVAEENILYSMADWLSARRSLNLTYMYWKTTGLLYLAGTITPLKSRIQAGYRAQQSSAE